MLSLAISELVVDLNIQPRANGLDQDHADGMAEYLRANPKNDLPAVVVYRDPATGDHVLSEGFHRAEAYARADRTHLPADVRDGDRLAAVANAMASNQAHGLKRTNADKRRAAEQMVRLFPDWSTRRIADHIGVDERLVSDVRPTRQVPESGTSKPVRVTGKDGKQYTVRKQSGGSKPAKGEAGAKEHAQKPNPDSTTQTPEPETEQPDTPAQADTDPGEAFVKDVERLCRDMDQIAARAKSLKASPYSHTVHIDSAVSQVEAARKTLWQGRPSEPCPYCRAAGEPQPGCKACRGLNRVKKTTYDAGVAAVGDAA